MHLSLIHIFCYVYTIALANASQVIVGYLMGAKRQAEVTNRVWHSMLLAIAISVGLATFFYITSDIVLSIFTTDPEILSLAHNVLLIEIDVYKRQPRGAFESPLSVCETAIAAGATFVAQGYMINRAQLVELIQKAMDHEGFSFINVFSPCVTYNKHNSYDWFKEHLVELPEGYDPTDRAAALKTLGETDGLVTGVIYQDTTKPSFEKALAAANGGPHPRPLTEDVVKPDQALFDSLCNQFK